MEAVDGISVDRVEIGSATFDVEASGADLGRVKEAIEEEGYAVVDL